MSGGVRTNDDSRANQEVRSLCMKLGHQLEEVRCRALKNLRTKVQLDLLHISDLESEPSLVDNLVDWFRRKPLSRPLEALDLIAALAAQSSSICQALIDADFLAVITDIRKSTSTSRELAAALDKVAQLVPASAAQERPYSAAAYEDDSEEDPLPERYLSELVSSSHIEETPQFDTTTFQASDITIDPCPQTSFLPLEVDLFPALKLSKTDGHVLDSIEKSLQDVQDVKRIQQVCGFMSQVIFEDFPVEVFLQRPGVINALFGFLWSPDAKDVLDSATLQPVLKCLQSLCRKVIDRCLWYTDSRNFGCQRSDDARSTSADSISVVSLGSRMSAIGEEDGTPDQPTSGGRVASPDASKASSVFEEDDDLQRQVMSVREFCCIGLLRALRAFRAFSLSQRQPAIFSILPDMINLTREFFQLAGICLKTNLWVEDSVWAPACRTHILSVFMAAMDVTSDDFIQSSRCPDWNVEFRRAARLTACLVSLGLVRAVVPASSVGDILPPAFMHQMYSVVLDPLLWTYWPKVKLSAETLLEEDDGSEFFEAIHTVVDSFDSLVAYFAPYTNEARKLLLAEQALPCLATIGPETFVRDVVNRLSLVCQTSRIDNMREHVDGILHALLRHHRPEVKHFACSELHNILLLIDNHPKRLKLLFSRVVLRDLLEDGMTGEQSTIIAKIIDRLLRSRRLFATEDWQEFVDELVPNLAFVQSHAYESTVEGHMILAVTLEDSRADVLSLGKAQDLLCCIRGLFSVDTALRERGFSRLLCLLADEPDAYKKLPLLTDPPTVTPDFLHVRPIQLEKPVNNEEPSSDSIFSHAANCGPSAAALSIILGQMALKLESSGAAAAFLREPGLDWLLKTLCDCVLKIRDGWRPGTVDMIPSVTTILMRLCLHDRSVVRKLCSDVESIGNLIRAAAVMQGNPLDRSNIAAVIFLIAFHDVLGDLWEGSSLLLPALIGARYRVPFVWLPEPNSSQEPKWARALVEDEEMNRVCSEFFRVCFAAACERAGGVKVDCGLCVTGVDARNMVITNPKQYASESLIALRRAADVEQNCVRLRTAVALVCFYEASGLPDESGGDCGRPNNQPSTSMESHPSLPDAREWIDAFQPFFFDTGVKQPSIGEKTLEQILGAAIEVLRVKAIRPNLSKWFANNCMTVGGRLMDSLEDLGRRSGEKTEAHRQMVRLIGEIHRGMHETTNADPELSALMMYRILNTLHVRDATDFYSLSWLLECLRAVAQLTSTDDWANCKLSETGRSGLITRALTTVIEIVAAFQAGRGVREDSFMGRGSTRFACFVLGNLAGKIALKPEDKILLSFFHSSPSGRDDPGLTWLVPLWTHRDPDIRAAGLDLVAKLTTSSKGCQLIAGNLTQIAGGLWGASLSFILDDREPSLTREKAAVILINLISNALAQKVLDGSLRLLLVRSGFLDRMIGIVYEFSLESSSKIDPKRFYARARTSATLLTSVCKLLNLMRDFCPKESEEAFGKLDLVSGLTSAVAKMAVPWPLLEAANPCSESPSVLAAAAYQVLDLLPVAVDSLPEEARRRVHVDFAAMVAVFCKFHSLEDKNDPAINRLLGETLFFIAKWIANDVDLRHGDKIIRAVIDAKDKVFGFCLEGLRKKLPKEANLACLKFTHRLTSLLRSLSSNSSPTTILVRDLVDDWQLPENVDPSKARDGLERRLGFALCRNVMKYHRYMGEQSSSMVAEILASLFAISTSAQRFILKCGIIPGLCSDLDAVASRLTAKRKDKSKMAAELYPALDLIASACSSNVDVRRQAINAGIGVPLVKLWTIASSDLDTFLRYINAVACVSSDYNPERHRSEWSVLSDRIAKHVFDVVEGSPSESRRFAVRGMIHVLTNLSNDVNCRQLLSRNKFAGNFVLVASAPGATNSKKNALAAMDDFILFLTRWTMFEEGAQEVSTNPELMSLITRAAGHLYSEKDLACRVILVNLSLNQTSARNAASNDQCMKLLETSLRDGPEDVATWAATVIHNLAQNCERSKAVVKRNRLDVIAMEKLENFKCMKTCEDIYAFERICDMLLRL